MKIRALTFESYHGKANVGSTRLRIRQLLPYMPELGLYKYGESPDAMIFQKVYIAPDWRFIEHYQGVKVLDICDPDWLDGAEVKRTIDALDGITCPTTALADFLRQLTDKPIKVIPDRHELKNFPEQASHSGPLSSLVWFGYKHNAETLRWAINFLVRNGVTLTVISNEDPMCWQWAEDTDKAEELYQFVKFDHETLNAELIKHDAAILPQGSRPHDRFKSNNKTVIAWLSGLPVITDADSFTRYQDEKHRREDAKANRATAEAQYDIQLSAKELRDFIESLAKAKQ